MAKIHKYDPTNGKYFGSLLAEEVPASIIGIVKIDAGDALPGYLADKLVAGTNITLTPVKVGGVKKIRITATASGGSGEQPNKTYFVSPSFSGTSPFFNTIETAIDSATDGDTIIIYPGYYNETKEIARTTNIYCFGDVVIDGEIAVTSNGTTIFGDEAVIASLVLAYQSSQVKVKEITSLTCTDAVTEVSARKIDFVTITAAGELTTLRECTIGEMTIFGATVSLIESWVGGEIRMSGVSSLAAQSTNFRADALPAISAIGEDCRIRLADCSIVGIGGASTEGFVKLDGLVKVHLKNVSFYEANPANCYCIYSTVGNQPIMTSGGSISNIPVYDVSQIGIPIEIEPLFIDYHIV